VLLWFTGPTAAAIDAVPSYVEIKAVVDAACEARCDLLKHATGVVNMSIRLGPITREHYEGLQDQTDQELCVDPEPFRNAHQVETTTTWYTNGNRKRYDIVTRKPTDPGAFLIESNLRTITDPAQSICYDVLHQEAYLDRPRHVYANPNGQAVTFDIHQLYRFNTQTIPELLQRWFEETKPPCTRDITKAKLGPTECLRIYCHPACTDPSGQTGGTMKLELWLAPQMAYALVKARIWCRSSRQAYFLLESCEASYEPSPAHPGIWLLKTLDYISNQAAENGSEILKATFTDTRIGVEVPAGMFTFEALGILPGTVVYDKTQGATPPRPYYRGMTPVYPRYYYQGRGRLEPIDG
jgi:hypothetical protein